MADSMTCSCCSRRGFLGVTLVSLFSGFSVLADRVHVVKKGETLFGLARMFDVSFHDLAEANHLDRRSKLQVGQRLSIPSKEEASQLSVALKKSFDRTPVKARRWKYVVIHHSATESGTVQGMDRYHSQIRHMEHGLAYHFVIGNGKGMKDGETVPSRRWKEQLAGGHLASEALNEISLGICLVGNFEVGVPTQKQLESLAGLINYLLMRCRLSRSAVKTHQQINTVYTRCPGKRFPVKTLLGMLA